jgi:MoxR-like ATPase
MAIKQLKGQEALSNILAEVSRVVIGKDEIKELLLVALLSRGHVLIEGTPGTAKTTTARTFAATIGGVFKRVQGTPDMLPSDILGFYLYRTDGSSTLIPGPIFANVLLADELNRTTPRTQAALLQAMQEHEVTIERETLELEKPFIVIASQVPFGGPGTSPLSDVQKDRFMFRVWSAISSLEEEDLILKNIDAISEPSLKAMTTPQEIVRLQEKARKVHVADSVRRYLLQIIDKLRHSPDTQAGPSTRAAISLLTGTRALAFIHGREFVIPDDVKALLVPTLSHRLQMTAEAEMEDITPESVIKEVAAAVPVPKMEDE